MGASALAVINPLQHSFCSCLMPNTKGHMLSQPVLIVQLCQTLWAASGASAAEVQETVLQDAATSAPSILGLSPLEVALLLLPPVLYGLFNLYRSQVNDKAKLVDFVSLLASVVIIGNIVSILVFKVRICLPLSTCCTHVEDTIFIYTACSCR